MLAHVLQSCQAVDSLEQGSRDGEEQRGRKQGHGSGRVQHGRRHVPIVCLQSVARERCRGRIPQSLSPPCCHTPGAVWCCSAAGRGFEVLAALVLAEHRARQIGCKHAADAALRAKPPVTCAVWGPGAWQARTWRPRKSRGKRGSARRQTRRASTALLSEARAGRADLKPHLVASGHMTSPPLTQPRTCLPLLLPASRLGPPDHRRLSSSLAPLRLRASARQSAPTWPLVG